MKVLRKLGYKEIGAPVHEFKGTEGKRSPKG
jgi:hypothetical protein